MGTMKISEQQFSHENDNNDELKMHSKKKRKKNMKKSRKNTRKNMSRAEGESVGSSKKNRRNLTIKRVKTDETFTTSDIDHIIQEEEEYDFRQKPYKKTPNGSR